MDMALSESTTEADSGLQYQRGFANDFASEAVAGALPDGQNSPQKAPLGLVSELVSGSTFSAPRALNRRSYLFRIRPSASRSAFAPFNGLAFLTPPFDLGVYPGPLRWLPFAIPEASTDFLDGIFTLCGNGSPKEQVGFAFHAYAANASMERRAFANADAECLILPQAGGIRVVTEMGILELWPDEVALVPKGMKFRVELLGELARGYLCENFGHPMVLPELGLIGSHGLANGIDFKIPVAAFEDIEEPFELVQKMAGQFWSVTLETSPFDVVAWRGNWTPSKYDMTRFNAMGTATFDHPDPSIYCALHSPSNTTMGPNLDFLILPPRWMVAEHTFRPPGYHRNAVAEILGVISGGHEARASNFPPGAISLHNCWTPHGPDTASYEAGREMPLQPTKISAAMIFMLETRFPIEIASQAMEAGNCQQAGHLGWQGFHRRFPQG